MNGRYLTFQLYSDYFLSLSLLSSFTNLKCVPQKSHAVLSLQDFCINFLSVSILNFLEVALVPFPSSEILEDNKIKLGGSTMTTNLLCI